MECIYERIPKVAHCQLTSYYKYVTIYTMTRRITRRQVTLTQTEAPAGGEVIVTLASNEKHFTFDQLGISYNDTEDRIIEAVADSIEEQEDIDIRDGYTLKKIDDTQNIYIFPKSVAG